MIPIPSHKTIPCSDINTLEILSNTFLPSTITLKNVREDDVNTKYFYTMVGD